MTKSVVSRLHPSFVGGGNPIRHLPHTLFNKREENKMKAKQTTFNLSGTGVIPARGHGCGVWGNRRIATGIRVDEKLYKAAKPIMQRLFGSTCRAIEAYLAALITTEKCIGNYGDSPRTTVDIGKIVIERNIKTRRKFVVEEVEREVSETVATCGFCRRPAVGVFENAETGKQQFACRFHAEVLLDHKKWRITDKEVSK